MSKEPEIAQVEAFGLNNVIALDEFVHQLHQSAHKFDAYWKAQRAKYLAGEADTTYPAVLTLDEWIDQYDAWMGMGAP